MPPRVGWDVDRAAQLYGAGWTLSRIGAELGVAPTSVGNQLRKTIKMRPAARPRKLPAPAPRAQPWRQVLLAALQQAHVIEVAAVIEAHLGRRPTRTEATAARRAANTLALTGRAVRIYGKLDTPHGARVHLLLGRPAAHDQPSVPRSHTDQFA